MSFLEHIVLHHLSNPGVYSGLRMKPERELAKLLNVSHHEVRRALERVEHLGFVVRRHGSGTFVRKRNHTGVPENRLREIAEIMTCGRRLASLSLDAQWRPRQSHLRNLMSDRFANYLNSASR